MTPREIKDFARVAHETDDKVLAMFVCEEITLRDLYLNVPKEPGQGEGRMITTRWANRPCKAGCGRMIIQGERAWWEPEWGVSHPECVGKK